MIERCLRRHAAGVSHPARVTSFWIRSSFIAALLTFWGAFAVVHAFGTCRFCGLTGDLAAGAARARHEAMVKR